MADKLYQMEVQAEPQYVAEQSSVANDVYVFAYRVRITNTGSEPAQLISRHWIITDANQQVQEVRGMGVVGEQPHLDPGQVFEYSSAAHITTPYGSMKGAYQMMADDGRRFEASIPEMTLVAPRVLH
ncbi:Co2+/Mg2+ efflux protein ApaG [Chromobacterium violaceum]|uniref:Protein ApaG n=2 Tax=Chromobacterium violaceum TaxID=536 RepID=APAG_CHRVO|nr:Co2+/Mg2+ efflux protein ApaG [Chromobacterium violaceum]Q7NW07.1 RecName: Full=Protein ApaG [Chromobacterium violaceum ATCC 12472]AAQ59856.1 apaG protein [Chromobacterium violaceum ATCC 12472]ATP28690.1 Co2+/Mg2+ efflux protein ApaG [Chromobacterium violaceum]ATP32600.1 Co2+/Mg2+ efflux protein ApaG [Chromobacterium violaceum]KJH66306.1 magnesium transporter ApaG [Chromobacterium violaceum]KMN49044.1 magnesium transporter ApaG [Chromobacterium violaceum]